MAYSKDKFALFFSLPIDEQDLENLNNSGVYQVMIPWAFANDQLPSDDNYDDDGNIERINSITRTKYGVSGATGVSTGGKVKIKVIVRMTPDDLKSIGVANAQNKMLRLKQKCDLRAVILGNEPEGNIDLKYGSPTWGQDWAYQLHLPELESYRRALSGHGVSILTPGWSMRNFSEGSPPEPGLVALTRVCEPVYNSMGNCVHFYGYGWPGMSDDPKMGSWVDPVRFMMTMRLFTMLWHQPLWIDEIGISRGIEHPIPQLLHMKACIGMSEAILRSNLKERVELFTPFVANGNPFNEHGEPSWPPDFVMKDPACYQELARYIAS